EEPMGLVHLGRAGSLGGEGLVGRSERPELVALEKGDLVAGAAEGERGGEPAHAAADDQHPLRHRSSPSPGWQRAFPETLGYGNDRCQLPSLAAPRPAGPVSPLTIVAPNGA